MDLSELAESEAPPSFYCPISRGLMGDPVTLADGHSYEREKIERWLATNNTSPKTGGRLVHRNLTPNHALRNSIEEFLERTFKIARRDDIQIIRDIGAGSFKMVHEGRLRGQQVAVLKMRPGADCLKEIKVLIRLRHPHLVRYLGMCTAATGLVARGSISLMSARRRLSRE